MFLFARLDADANIDIDEIVRLLIEAARLAGCDRPISSTRTDAMGRVVIDIHSAY